MKAIEYIRLIYAIYYFAAGIGVALLIKGTVRIGTDLDFGPGVNAILLFMRDTEFLLWLLAASYLLGSVLLMISKTAPLGVLLLAPAVIVILFTHWCVEGGNPLWGTGNAAILLLLAWHYREVYYPMPIISQ